MMYNNKHADEDEQNDIDYKVMNELYHALVKRNIKIYTVLCFISLYLIYFT